MKKIILVFMTYVSLTLSSCEKDNINYSKNLSNIDKKELVNFNGEKILLQNNLTVKDIESYLANQSSSISNDAKNFRLSNDKIDWSKITKDQLFSFISESFKKYPDLRKEDFDELDMKTISKDIPTIKNNEDAKFKKSIISDYYNMLVIKDIEKLIEKHLKSSKILIDYGTANAFELQKSKDDPFAGYCVGKIAREEADALTVQKYNGVVFPDDIKSNAFRHAAWNAIGVQEIAVVTKNKWTSLSRTRKLTCAHEYVTYNNGISWEQSNSIQTAMDLNNNMAGRTYMYNKITTFLGIAGNIPSDSKIGTDLVAFSFNKKTSITDIFNLSSSYNWGSLGNLDNAMDYHTPTQNQFVYLLDYANQ